MKCHTMVKAMSSLLVVLFVACCNAAVATGAAVSTAQTTLPPEAVALQQEAREFVSNAEKIVDAMTRQLMQQQTFVEERIRSEGMSGIKSLRHTHEGTSPLFGDTHIGYQALNMGDRTFSERKLAIGDFTAVMNGVEFHKLLNGEYMLKKAADKNAGLDELVDIDLPDVPPAVTNKRTIQEQVEEMKLWFKAFKDQDHSVRDYRKYFKPNLCYLEGAWYLNHRYINEPDTSEKHYHDTDRWFELLDFARFQSYGGTLSNMVFYEYMPTKIYNITENGIPQFAFWKSRLMCHPYSGELRTDFFKPQDDLSARLSRHVKWTDLSRTSYARFKINEFGTDRNTQATVLDKIMGEIPGKDNYGAFISDDAFGLKSVDITKTGDVPLNAAKYHRWYKLSQAGAMGLSINHRGFHDEHLWVAQNTREDIMPLSVHRRVNGIDYWETRRMSYALPLEIAYATPLAKWNPYNIENHGMNCSHVTAHGRNGRKDAAHAWDGVCDIRHYLTPPELYDGSRFVNNSIRGVLDRDRNVKLLLPSGLSTFSFPFGDDIGRVRLRYPIFPVHSEGTTQGMELEALKDAVMKMSTHAYLYERQPMTKGATQQGTDVEFHVRDTGRTPPGLHGHDFTLTADEHQKLLNGTELTVITSYNLGHVHELVIYFLQSHQSYRIRTCDNANNCWDGHSKTLEVHG